MRIRINLREEIWHSTKVLPGLRKEQPLQRHRLLEILGSQGMFTSESHFLSFRAKTGFFTQKSSSSALCQKRTWADLLLFPCTLYCSVLSEIAPLPWKRREWVSSHQRCVYFTYLCLFVFNFLPWNRITHLLKLNCFIAPSNNFFIYVWHTGKKHTTRHVHKWKTFQAKFSWIVPLGTITSVMLRIACHTDCLFTIKLEFCPSLKTQGLRIRGEKRSETEAEDRRIWRKLQLGRRKRLPDSERPVPEASWQEASWAERPFSVSRALLPVTSLTLPFCSETKFSLVFQLSSRKQKTLLFLQWRDTVFAWISSPRQVVAVLWRVSGASCSVCAFAAALGFYWDSAVENLQVLKGKYKWWSCVEGGTIQTRKHKWKQLFFRNGATTMAVSKVKSWNGHQQIFLLLDSYLTNKEIPQKFFRPSCAAMATDALSLKYRHVCCCCCFFFQVNRWKLALTFLWQLGQHICARSWSSGEEGAARGCWQASPRGYPDTEKRIARQSSQPWR